MSTYTVQSGDTLGTIAQKFLGDSQRYKEVAAVNPQITDLNLIKVGQVINIPDTNTATTIPPKVNTGFSFPSLIPSANASEGSMPSTGSLMDKIKELANNKKLLAAIAIGIIGYMYYQSRKSKK